MTRDSLSHSAAKSGSTGYHKAGSPRGWRKRSCPADIRNMRDMGTNVRHAVHAVLQFLANSERCAENSPARRPMMPPYSIKTGYHCGYTLSTLTACARHGAQQRGQTAPAPSHRAIARAAAGTVALCGCGMKLFASVDSNYDETSVAASILSAAVN